MLAVYKKLKLHFRLRKNEIIMNSTYTWMMMSCTFQNYLFLLPKLFIFHLSSQLVNKFYNIQSFHIEMRYTRDENGKIIHKKKNA